MCGIYGFVGSEAPCNKLTLALEKLQYRGYDSSGIAYIKNEKIVCVKDAKTASFLASKPLVEKQTTSCGIAHTRWATHGKPCKQNAHPFCDEKNEYAIVHNGIIENFAELKSELKEEGVVFKSETDSEVIAHMFALSKAPSMLDIMQEIAKRLIGSYAVAVISNTDKNAIYVFKNKSPLAVGNESDFGFVSSDIGVCRALVSNYYFLNDKEFAVVTKNSVKIYNENKKQIDVQMKVVSKSEEGQIVPKYKHFMLSEIFETAPKLKLTAKNIFDTPNKDVVSIFKNRKRIFVVACGTAFHAGEIFARQIEKSIGVACFTQVASEFRYVNHNLTKDDLCFFVSQSGETADTIACMDLAKESGSTTCALLNVKESTMARKADYVFYTEAGKEIGVASTKAFSCQILALDIIASYANENITSEFETYENFSKEYSEFEKNFELFLHDSTIPRIAETFSFQKSVYFIGRGIDYIFAKEGALKLKEISLIHAEALASGELKHGGLSLVEDGFWTVIILTEESTKEKALIAASEIKARKGKILLITPFEVSEKLFDEVIFFPQIPSKFNKFYVAAAIQLLAYFVTVKKNLSPDMPRNLAKSVTVE